MFYLQNNRPGHQDASHEPTLTSEAAASAGLDEGSPSAYPMLVGSTSARTGGMLTRVALRIAMTNAVSPAATCARAEVPPSSVSDARPASGKSLPGCCAPAILVRTFSLDRLGAVRSDRYLCTRHGARSAPVRAGTHSSQPIARKGTHKIKQIGVSRSEVFVTGVAEP